MMSENRTKELETIYSEIPMRTWRWLGVNEGTVPTEVLTDTVAEERVIKVPKNATETIVLEYRDEAQASVRVELGENAELELIRVQLCPADQIHAGNVEVSLADHAKLHYTAVEAGAEKSVTKLTVDMDGKESEADIYALYFGDGKRKIDMNYLIRQKGLRTKADMQVRGALMDECDKIFRGTLDFLQGSKGSVGAENEEVVSLSSKVRNRSVPIMLSAEDDVDGHHAVSIGKMDESKLFYLMSRGLDMAEARKLVVEAAFHPVLSRIPNEELREEIDSYLMGRLSR